MLSDFIDDFSFVFALNLKWQNLKLAKVAKSKAGCNKIKNMRQKSFLTNCSATNNINGLSISRYIKNTVPFFRIIRLV